MCKKWPNMGKYPHKYLEITKNLNGRFSYFTHHICAHCFSEGKIIWNCCPSIFIRHISSPSRNCSNPQWQQEQNLKNKALNEACDKLGIKRLFSNPFNLQVNSRIENVHNVLKQTFRIQQTGMEWSLKKRTP